LHCCPHLAHGSFGGWARGDLSIAFFVATANTIIHAGCTPVFADCAGTDDLTISHFDIEKKITSATKGITVMHYGGHPCAMEEILDIARRHNLYIVEDCAHSPGASIKGRMTGTCGDIGCFSFFSNKNLSTGEGGMIVTDRDDLAEKIRLLRSHGMTSLTLDRYKGHAITYNVINIGYNYRSSEINAAIGRIQLVKLSEKNQKRQDLCRSYIERIQQKNFGGRIVVPFEACRKSSSTSWHIFVILLPEDIDRIGIMELIRKEGVQKPLSPIHRFKAFQQYSNKLTFLF
jgi:dTDP-4-amino-4,6-dideoxygalactose transaminase